MKMAQDEKLVKKWESQDGSENASGVTTITLTDRRIVTERVNTVGEQTDKNSQEIFLDNVKGVAYSNQKRIKINWWIIAGIVLGLALFFILLVEFENNYMEERIAAHIAGLIPSAILIVIGLKKQKSLFGVETSYRIILYTDATCTFNVVGELSFGATSTNFGGEKILVPVSYEVAQEICEEIGAYLVMAKYGVSAETKKA